MTADGGIRVVHTLQVVEHAGGAPFSGAEHHVFQLVEGLAGAGIDVSIVLIVVGGGPVIEERVECLERRGIRVVVVPGERGTAMVARTVPALRRTFNALMPDVVHSHLWHGSEITRIAARLARTRATVDSVHNDDPILSRPGPRTRMRALDPLTSRYVAISSAVERLMEDGVGLARRKIDVVPYGIDLPNLVLPSAMARKRLDLGDDRFVAGFVGRLTPQKNVASFVRMVASSPDVVGVVVGDGELGTDLRRLAADLGADCRFVGHRPDAADLMTAFDVLCLPSHWEGLGLVLLEAMARHVAVVGSDAGAIPEVLGDGRFGRVFPVGDQAAFEAAVDRCRTAREETYGLADDALERVRAYHSTERMVDDTLRVYKRALSG